MQGHDKEVNVRGNNKQSAVTHSDDVILPEAQLVVVMTLKVQQSLGPSSPVAGHNKKVFMVSLVTLHGVVRSQLLHRHGGSNQAEQGTISRSESHSAGVMWVQTVEMLCGAGYGLSESCYQLCLLYVLGLQRLGFILSKQERAQGGLSTQGLSPHDLHQTKRAIAQIHDADSP